MRIAKDAPTKVPSFVCSEYVTSPDNSNTRPVMKA